MGCLLHNQYQDKFINFFKEIDFDIRPESMNISWDDIDNCLKTLKDFADFRSAGADPYMANRRAEN